MARSLNTILVAVVYASSLVVASPWPTTSKHATHRVRHIGAKRELELETYHPKGSYKTYGKGTSKPESFTAASASDASVAFTSTESGIKSDNIKFSRGFKSASTGVEHSYLRQQYNGIPVLNTAANVAIKADNVMSFSSSFIDTDKVDFPSAEPSVSLDSVISDVESSLDGRKLEDVKASLGYLARSDNSPALVHVVQIKNEKTFTWYEAYVDAHSGELLSVTDFVNDLSYKVLPIKEIGFPDGLETVEDPEDEIASPDGWVENDETAGNNVVSYKDDESETSAAPFDYTYDDTISPTEGENVDASRVNAFYLINKVHDIWYEYGFTEEAFNFQNDNYGKGGEGNDRVLMSIQDASGTDNANFATPPDGQSGQCRMYIWTQTDPERDGTMDTSIPVHEYTHGLTNRLTGGGTGACLQTTESGGMGEGWSDAFAEWVNLKGSPVPDYVLAQYVAGTEGGIRTVPYSTDHNINSLMYSTIQELNEVHDIGEIWATILHGVLSSLVEEKGYNPDADVNPDAEEGNAVYLHLFIDSLALQPCNPTMVEARDAWIQADENRYDGANKCLLWAAFADRGLGPDAADYTDDTSVPSDC